MNDPVGLVGSVASARTQTSESVAPNNNNQKVSLSPQNEAVHDQQHGVVLTQNINQHNSSNPISEFDTMESADGMRDVPVQHSSPPQRKSSRSKTSTLIYIDGQAVKKENNYVVKGMQYVYGADVGNPEPPKRQTVSKEGPKEPPKPRIVTAQEAERRDKKAKIENTIRDKAPLRNQFLKQHLPVLTPFIESKVVHSIQESVGDPSSSIDKSPMYMQPDLITGDMRSYQLSGLNWMAKMYSMNVGAILGDEMGLGKVSAHLS